MSWTSPRRAGKPAKHHPSPQVVDQFANDINDGEGDDDAFGSDFDEFEEGEQVAADDDFGDFDEPFEGPSGEVAGDMDTQEPVTPPALVSSSACSDKYHIRHYILEMYDVDRNFHSNPSSTLKVLHPYPI